MSKTTTVNPGPPARDRAEGARESPHRAGPSLEPGGGVRAPRDRAEELLASIHAATRDAERFKSGGAPGTARPGFDPHSLPWRSIGIVLLLVALGAGGYTLVHEKLPPPLERTDFGELEGVQDVMSRPPDVYFTVLAAEWRRWTEEQRREFLQHVVQTAEPQGYMGAHVVTDDGRLAGQWLKNGQMRLF